MVSNSFARDESLSLAARGLGLWLLSHVDGWETTTERIAQLHKIGRDQTRRLLRELEHARYLRRTRERRERNKLAGMVYEVQCTPFPEEKPSSNLRLADQSLVDQGLEPGQHKKTTSTKTTPEKITPSGGARDAAPVPSLEAQSSHQEEEPVVQPVDNLALFDAPPKAAKTKAAKPPAAPGAHTVVAAYVDAYRRTHGGADPIKSHIMRVGREAKEILGRGEAGPEELARAAVALGGTEYLALGIQLSRLRKSAGPVAGQRQGMAPASPHTDEYWQEAGKRNDESWYHRLLTDDAAVEWVKGDPAQVEEILRKWPELETRLRGAA